MSGLQSFAGHRCGLPPTSVKLGSKECVHTTCMLVRPHGLVIVTPGPGPEERKHLRWATGVFRSGPTRACWKALRAGLSRPSSLPYRWAGGILSGRDPLVLDRVPFQVVPRGLVGKLCEPSSRDH